MWVVVHHQDHRLVHDYAVIAAGSGEEGLNAARELKARGADLAILMSDQRMPGILGVELLASAREGRRRAVPTAAPTARNRGGRFR
jgi:thioredoxin reductase (NADPH)